MDIQELAQEFRRRRQELGYSLEEVVEKTKLYPSAIKALEEGSLEKISPIYRRGFIKIYASFLGIDASEVLKDIALFEEEAKALPKGPGLKKSLPLISLPRVSPKFKKVFFLSLLSLVLLFILAKGVSLIFKKISSKPLVQKKEEKPAPVQKPLVVTKPLKKGQVSLGISAKRDCFLRVRVDGKLLFEGVFRKGQSKVWQGTKEIELKAGDASAIYIEVNGKALPAISAGPRPIKSLKVDPSGINIEK